MTTRYYTLLYKRPDGKGESVIFTNLRRIIEFTGTEDGLTYNLLLEHFSRKKLDWYENPYKGLMIIKSHTIIKGEQRVARAHEFNSRNK